MATIAYAVGAAGILLLLAIYAFKLGQRTTYAGVLLCVLMGATAVALKIAN